MRIHDVVLNEEREAIKNFLKTFDLTYEEDIDDTIMVTENGRIIATASTSHNIIKCIAIASDYQGQNMTSLLMTEIIKRLANKGINHYFVYTLDEQVPLFKSLGLRPIVQTMTLALLEGGGSIQSALNQLKEDHAIDNTKKAAVVINANPLTLGHLHLIETAQKNHQHLLVFVVSEDRSVFPFKARINIVKKACKKYPNVTVLPSLDYLVSYATFPKYFLQKEAMIREEHAMVDVLTFKNYYMKTFNIVKRYVGEEPISAMTNMYNETMKKYLNQNLIIIPRKYLDGMIISASTVRKHLKNDQQSEAYKYLPQATIDFLESKEGHDAIRALKKRDTRH